MRQRIVFALIFINVLLASAILIGPVAAQVFPRAAFLDCCQGPTCCDNCCFFISDCTSDEECDPE